MEKALEILKNGGVILYPTDTIWGNWLRCNKCRSHQQNF